MTVSAADFERFAEAQNNASLLAQRELAAIWDSVEGMEPEAQRNALLVAVPGIVARYGDIAASAAAEYYETERSAAGGGAFSAELSEGVPIEQVEASVRYACGHLFPEEDGEIRPEPDASLLGGQGR